MGKLRAERLREAVSAYRERGGTLRGLAREAQMAPANIYKGMNTGEGLGRETLARLAPALGCSIGWLTGVEEDQSSAPMPLKNWLLWLGDLPREILPELKKIGDALAAQYKASHGGKSGKRGRKDKRQRKLRMVPSE